MHTPQNNLPPVFLSPGEKLVVSETHNFWGRKTTTYRVVTDTSNGTCVVWLVTLFVITLITVAIAIYLHKPVPPQKTSQVNNVYRKD